EGLVTRAAHLATGVSDGLHNDALPRYLTVIIAAATALGIYAFHTGALSAADRPLLPITPIALVAWVVVAVACLLVLRWHGNRLVGVVLTGVVGLMISIAFLHFSAPDLALTQISVEVVTTVLLLLALNYLPKTTPPEHAPRRIARDAALAAISGLAIA